MHLEAFLVTDGNANEKRVPVERFPTLCKGAERIRSARRQLRWPSGGIQHFQPSIKWLFHPPHHSSCNLDGQRIILVAEYQRKMTVPGSTLSHEKAVRTNGTRSFIVLAKHVRAGILIERSPGPWGTLKAALKGPGQAGSTRQPFGRVKSVEGTSGDVFVVTVPDLGPDRRGPRARAERRQQGYYGAAPGTG